MLGPNQTRLWQNPGSFTVHIIVSVACDFVGKPLKWVIVSDEETIAEGEIHLELIGPALQVVQINGRMLVEEYPWILYAGSIDLHTYPKGVYRLCLKKTGAEYIFAT